MTGHEKAPGGMPGTSRRPEHRPTGSQATRRAALGPAENPFQAVLAVMESAGLIPGFPAQSDRDRPGRR